MKFNEAMDIFKNLFFDPVYNGLGDPFYNFTFNCNLMDSCEITEVLENVDVLKKFFRKEISSEEEIPTYIFLLLYKYLKKEKVKGLSFYTICPRQRLPFNESEVMKLEDFCKKFFENEKLFENVKWVVESGKHKDCPNLHIHALISFKKCMGKNFSRVLKSSWARVYPDPQYTIDYNVKGNKGIHRAPCNTLLIQRDKETYMSNSSKGSHENFVDLNVSGEFSSDSSTAQ